MFLLKKSIIIFSFCDFYLFLNIVGSEEEGNGDDGDKYNNKKEGGNDNNVYYSW